MTTGQTTFKGEFEMAKHRSMYNTEQVLQLAIIVDSQQGFVKSGNGYYDFETEKTVHDNKTTINNYLNGIDGFDMPEISDSVKQQATEIVESFRNTLVAKKLMNTMNSFEEGVLKTISSEQCDNFGVSILASLPNSFRVQEKRQGLDDWFSDMRPKSEFIGKPGERMRFEALVKDVKFIAKYGIHLVTCVTKEENIVKFFFSKEPDIVGLLEGRNVILTGKVKQHDVSKFSDCKETVINYVKVEEKG